MNSEKIYVGFIKFFFLPKPDGKERRMDNLSLMITIIPIIFVSFTKRGFFSHVFKP